MAGIFVLAALLWVTEALPLFATSLLVVGLQMVSWPIPAIGQVWVFNPARRRPIATF